MYRSDRTLLCFALRRSFARQTDVTGEPLNFNGILLSRCQREEVGSGPESTMLQRQPMRRSEAVVSAVGCRGNEEVFEITVQEQDRGQQILRMPIETESSE